MTITAAAAALGVSRKHLSNVLHGRAALEEPLLRRLCEAVEADAALVRSLSVAPPTPSEAARRALRGTVRVVSDPTEPMAGWEIAEG